MYVHKREVYECMYVVCVWHVLRISLHLVGRGSVQLGLHQQYSTPGEGVQDVVCYVRSCQGVKTFINSISSLHISFEAYHRKLCLCCPCISEEKAKTLDCQCQAGSQQHLCW
jgi:hypothetical protein